MTVKEYIKKGETLEYSDEWAKALENASAKVHISRLDAMKFQLRQECEELYGSLENGLGKTMKGIYENGYYQTAYEIMKGQGVGYTFHRIDTRRIEKAINTVWAGDGKNFRARCWTSKEKLAKELQTVLTQSIIRGEAPDKAIKQLAKRMNVSKFNAGRLIMTESAFISSQSQKDCYKELDVEQFQFVATLDSLTSDLCRAMDLKVFRMSDYEIGVNAPPLHCFCRSCTVPYFEDNYGIFGKRAAREADGKVVYVDADVTYEEWKKTFVDGDDKSNFETDSGMQLNEGEKGAVMKYVSPDSIILNDKLRKKESLTAEESKWVDNLHSALEKLPYYEGNLNRSLTFKFDEDAKKYFDSLVVGKEFTPGHFLSTTKTGMYNEKGQVQIYIEGAKKGKDLGDLAIENEVLYSDTSKFIILNKTIELGKYWILLEEI